MPLLRRVRDCEHRGWRGQSIVEFALAAPVFLALVFGIVEFGLLLHSYITMQHAVDEAARYAVTGEGYDAGTGVREAAILDVARAAASSLMISDGAYADQAGYYHVSIRSSGSSSDPSEADNAGEANQYVRVVMQFNHPAFTWILGGSGAYIPLTTEALVINERFARPLGTPGALPAEPAYTATPSGPVYTLITGVAEGTGSVTVSPAPNFGGQYTAGTVVTVHANPFGSTFVAWSGDSTSASSTVTVTMNSNKTLLAHFSGSSYTLTVYGSADCTGWSVSPGVGMHTYAQGSVVTLTASGTTACPFVGWSGAASGSGSPVSITINGDMSVTAGFGASQYTLHVYKAGSGTGTMTPAEGTYTYPRDTLVSLGAGVPAAGSQFLGWLCGGQACTSVTMDADKSVYARFELAGTGTAVATATTGPSPTPTRTNTPTPTYTPTNTPTNTPTPVQYALTISTSGSCVGTVGPFVGTQSRDAGTTVSVSAGSTSSCRFTGFGGAISGTTSPQSVLMNGNKTVTAYFEPVQYTLTISTSGSCVGTVGPFVGTQSRDAGTTVSVSASGTANCQFTGWSGAITGTGSPQTITMNGNKSVTASFAPVQYTLTISTSGSCVGTVGPFVGTQSRDAGTTVSVSAGSTTGCRFVGWSGAASGSGSSVSITMDGNKTVTANFVRQYRLTISINRSWCFGGSVSPGEGEFWYDAGSSVTLSATDGGWGGCDFDRWRIDGSNYYSRSVTITMNSDRSVVAQFD